MLLCFWNDSSKVQRSTCPKVVRCAYSDSADEWWYHYLQQQYVAIKYSCNKLYCISLSLSLSLLALQPPMGVVFYSPLVGFSLLACEVSWSHTTTRRFGWTPLNEWSVRRRDLYLTTHNNHNRQISMPRVGFEPTISAGERPKTYALDRAATGTGLYCIL